MTPSVKLDASFTEAVASPVELPDENNTLELALQTIDPHLPTGEMDMDKTYQADANVKKLAPFLVDLGMQKDVNIYIERLKKLQEEDPEAEFCDQLMDIFQAIAKLKSELPLDELNTPPSIKADENYAQNISETDEDYSPKPVEDFTKITDEDYTQKILDYLENEKEASPEEEVQELENVIKLIRKKHSIGQLQDQICENNGPGSLYYAKKTGSAIWTIGKYSGKACLWTANLLGTRLVCYGIVTALAYNLPHYAILKLLTRII